MEETLYKARRVTITNRKIVFAQRTVPLASIRAVSLEQSHDTSNIYRTLLRGFAWGVPLVVLDFLTPIPSVFLFFAIVIGLWWLTGGVWPYIVYAETHSGKEIVFSSRNREHAEEVARELCEALGIKIKFSQKTKRKFH